MSNEQGNVPSVNASGPGDMLLNEEHVAKYRETNGEIGYIWNGATALLMTMTGRKSKEERTIPIIFTQVGDAQVIIASKGGAPTHPVWFLNVQEDPKVKVQIKGEIFDAIARVAESPEREMFWAEAIKQWPRYDLYQSRTERKIPVVVLEKVGV